MSRNPFFEGTARVQVDRHQHVVDQGPYRLIRHPGYLGLSLWAVSTPLLLRSRWAFVAAGMAAAWIALRTGLEDRMLQAGLGGYEAYARRVSWRLVPGVW
jgi:protein-S-isoprenylcysteine O-methyltransferase Ste14